MLASMKKYTLAAAITLGAATAMTLGSSVVHTQPAEAGVLSSIKKAATKTVSYTAGGVAHWAKSTASGAKYAASHTVVPMAKGIGSTGYSLGKKVVKAVAPIVKKTIEKLKTPPVGPWAPRR